MASLRITPVPKVGRDENGQLTQAPYLDNPLSLTLATASATSSAVGTDFVMLYAEADCHFTQDDTDATVSDHFMAAGERIVIGHKKGNTIRAKNTS